MVESNHLAVLALSVVGRFVLVRLHVADRGVQPGGVVPVHLLGGGQLDLDVPGGVTAML